MILRELIYYLSFDRGTSVKCEQYFTSQESFLVSDIALLLSRVFSLNVYSLNVCIRMLSSSAIPKELYLMPLWQGLVSVIDVRLLIVI